MARKQQMVIHQFLLVRDRKNDELIMQRDFGEDIDAANAAYTETEAKYRGQPWMDVLLVGADSIETIKKTHSTYFSKFTAADFSAFMDSLKLDELAATLRERKTLASA